jgi:pimeloyl-ACP methyl ester carboxylesterase
MGRILARPDGIRQALRLRRSHYALNLDATGLRDRLHAGPQPVGVIWGMHDPLLPPDTLGRVRADLPQALRYRLPRSGHIPM